MCILPTPSTPDAPVLPPEPQQAKDPSGAQLDAAGRRTEDKIRAGTDTILTSGLGVTAKAPTEKKTLLGQ